MTHALVTGGTGFIGQHTLVELRAQGVEVTSLDWGTASGPEVPGVHYAKGDVTDPDTVRQLLRPETRQIIHLAAVVGVDQYVRDPLSVIDTNFEGTRSVLDAAADHGCTALLASTSEVFGKNPAVPWTEDSDRVLGSTRTDRWSYASSKALAEHLVFAHARSRGTSAAIVRFFNVYGPGQRPAFLVSRSVHRALNGLPLLAYDEGQQTRCLTYVEDVIPAMLSAAEIASPEVPTFNLGSMSEVRVRDVLDTVAHQTGADIRSVAASGHGGYEDLKRRIPDATHAERELGWRATTSHAEGIRKTVEWARSNPDWLANPDTGVVTTAEGVSAA